MQNCSFHHVTFLLQILQVNELVQYWKDVITTVGTGRLEKLIRKKKAEAAPEAAGSPQNVKDPVHEPFDEPTNADDDHFPLTQQF
jgi:hypothetical protein